MTGSHWVYIPLVQSLHKVRSNILEQDDIHDLTEQQPGVVLGGQVLVFVRKRRQRRIKMGNLTSKEIGRAHV